MKKGKKVTLAISLTSALVPLLIFSSCSSSSNTKMNYTISAKVEPKIEIEDLQGVNYKSLATLEKLFVGVDANNIDFFEVLIDSKVSQDISKYKVTLTAKEGYVINGEQTLDSNEFIVIIPLDIIAKDNPAIDWVDIEGENFQSLATLEKLFSGITANNLNKFHVSISPEVSQDISKYKVTLTAKEGYVINGEQTLDSSEFIVIIPLDIIAKDNPTIDWVDIEGENYQSLATLEKLFGGITANNLDKFNVSISPEVSQDISKYKVTLTAKEGYVINGEQTLDSNEFIVIIPLDIIAKDNPAIDWVDIEGENFQSLATLEKLFSGVTANNLNKFNVSISPEVSQDISKYKVTLTAKEGYVINGEQTLDSNEFIVIIPLDIIAKDNPVIDRVDIEDENYQSLATLEKLFGGITANNLDKFHVSISPEVSQDISKYKVTLTAKEGYVINGEQTLDSDEFVAIVPLDIIAKDNPAIDWVDIEGENFQSLATLEKLFSGVTENNLNKFHVSIRREISQDISKYKVTLTAKEGYTINGEKSIDSKEFTIKDIVLNITPKNNPELDILDIQILNDGMQNNDLEVLVKLFDGIDETNINFTTNSLVSNMVTLNTKSGYIFSNDLNSITVNFNMVDILIEVTPKPGPIELTQREVDDMSISVLNKLFNGIGETTKPWLNNFSHDGYSSVVLTANPGYIFPSGITVRQDIIVVNRTRNSKIKNIVQNSLWDSPIILVVLLPNKFGDK